MHDEDLLARELDEYADGSLAPPDDWEVGHAVEPPETRDPEAADRLLARLYRIDEEAAAIERLAERRLAPILQWRADRLAGLDRARDFWQQQLAGWARANHTDTAKGRTWNLPHGSVVLRKRQPKIEIEQPSSDEILAELRGVVPASAIETVHKVKPAEVKKVAKPGPVLGTTDDGYERRQAMTADGERIPGAVLLVPVGLGFDAKPTIDRGTPIEREQAP